jgi:hypothetical protein
VTGTDAGQYFLVISNVAGVVTSSVVPLTLIAPANLFESAASAEGAVAFYPLNETGDPASSYVIAVDNAGGFDGVYGSMVQDGNPLYNIAGPQPSDGFPAFSDTNTAAFFTTDVPDFESQITVPPLYLNTNTVTLTAWINPFEQQGAYAGIVFCRGSGDMVAGLDFIAFTNATVTSIDLGYHWDNDANTYTWQSGLMPPINQWSFVALVVTPTNATVWLMNTNGITSATHTYNHVVQAFDAQTTIGNDPYDSTGSRGFYGAIADVGILNSALSQAQVTALYNAALNVPPPLPIQIAETGGHTQITWSWPGAASLLQATNLAGPWVTNSGATSPYYVTPVQPQQFYRLLIQ